MTAKRIALSVATVSRWLFLVIFVGWIITTIVFAFQGEWRKVGSGLAYIVGFGLLYFVVIPRGVPRLLKRMQPPKSS